MSSLRSLFVTLLIVCSASFSITAYAADDEDFNHEMEYRAFSIFNYEKVPAGTLRHGCSAVIYNEYTVLTGRHCITQVGDIYVNHERSDGWVRGVTYYTADNSPGLYSSLSDDRDIVMLKINMPASGDLNTFKTQASLLQFLAKAQKLELTVHMWGLTSGVRTFLVANIIGNQIVLNGRVQDGDSGAPIWIGKKFVGLVHGTNLNGYAIVDLFYRDLFSLD